MVKAGTQGKKRGGCQQKSCTVAAATWLYSMGNDNSIELGSGFAWPLAIPKMYEIQLHAHTKTQ